jgi:hypothetical protein
MEATMTQTTWTKDSIKTLLLTNPRAVERAMLVLFARQTEDERVNQTTRHENARGFTAAHARKGSYYAKWVRSGRNLTGHHLDRARTMALHYTRQLLEEVEAKASKTA